MISLMLVVAATTTSFAKSNNTDVANAVKSVAEQVKQAPSGTVYGVVENTKHHITVATNRYWFLPSCKGWYIGIRH